MTSDGLVKYVTNTKVEYVVSPIGNLRDGKEIGRAVYLSPADVARLFVNAKKKEPKRLNRDKMFLLNSYDIKYGKVIYENPDGSLGLSGNVISRDPEFETRWRERSKLTEIIHSESKLLPKVGKDKT